MAARAVGLAAAGSRRGVNRRALAGAAGGAPRRAGSRRRCWRRARRLSSVRHIADLYDRYAVHRPAMLRDLGGRTRRWLAGRVVEAAARAYRRAEPGRAAGGRLRAAAGRAVARRPACAGVAVRTDASAGELPRRPATRSRPSATCTSSFSTPRPSCGRESPRSPVTFRRSSAATRMRRRRCRENPLLASWGRDAREMQLVLAGGPEDVVSTTTWWSRSGARRCSAESRPTFAPTARRRACPLPGAADERVLLDAGRSQPAGSRVPRPRSPGRGRAGRDPAPARRRPDARAARHRRHVPRYRGLRAARSTPPSGPVRRRRRGRGSAGGREPDRPARAPGRPLAAADQRGARRRRAAARPRRPPPHRLAGARSGGARAGAPPLPPRRRRPGADRAVGARRRRALGSRCGAACLVPARAPARPTRGRRAGIACWWAWRWRRRDSGCSAGCCRSTTSAAATSTSPAASPSFSSAFTRSSTPSPRRCRSTLGPTAIADAADSLTAAPGREAWQRVQLGRLLEDVVAEGTTAGAVTQTPLALPEIRALLADRLRGRPTRASFRTGHLTICTLVPMRSVPHRVVCLIGLDDGVFPRQTARDGDDLLLARSARR